MKRQKRLRDSHDGKIRSFQADKEIKIAALDTEMAQQEKNIESELAQLEERIKSPQREERRPCWCKSGQGKGNSVGV